MADNALTRHHRILHVGHTTRRHPPLRSDVVRMAGTDSTSSGISRRRNNERWRGKEPQRLRFIATDRVYLARNRPKRKMQTKREFYKSASAGSTIRRKYRASECFKNSNTFFNVCIGCKRCHLELTRDELLTKSIFDINNLLRFNSSLIYLHLNHKLTCIINETSCNN